MGAAQIKGVSLARPSARWNIIPPTSTQPGRPSVICQRAFMFRDVSCCEMDCRDKLSSQCKVNNLVQQLAAWCQILFLCNGCRAGSCRAVSTRQWRSQALRSGWAQGVWGTEVPGGV